MKQSIRSGAALATAAALVFGALDTAPAQAEEAKIKCLGVNACKGQSACMGARNACKGMNACKGQGYLTLTKSQCDAAQAKVKTDQGKDKSAGGAAKAPGG